LQNKNQPTHVQKKTSPCHNPFAKNIRRRPRSGHRVIAESGFRRRCSCYATPASAVDSAADNERKACRQR
jgi:hypothetical protein